MSALLGVLLSLSDGSYRIESWVLLGLITAFIVLYAISLFKKKSPGYVDIPKQQKSFLNTKNSDSKATVTKDFSEVEIEGNTSWLSKKATETNLSAQKLADKVDTKEDLEKLKKLRG